MLDMERKVNLTESYQELCLFADEFDLDVRIDKPFKEMPQLVLKVYHRDKVLGEMILEDIYELGDKSAELLNSLSKNKN